MDMIFWFSMYIQKVNDEKEYSFGILRMVYDNKK